MISGCRLCVVGGGVGFLNFFHIRCQPPSIFLPPFFFFLRIIHLSFPSCFFLFLLLLCVGGHPYPRKAPLTFVLQFDRARHAKGSCRTFVFFSAFAHCLNACCQKVQTLELRMMRNTAIDAKQDH